jgi:hypothetical protein
MTSISLNASAASFAARSTHQHNGPRADMDSKISAAVEAGALTQTDATALESALDKIDSSLSSSTSGSAGKLDPSGMKAKVDDLIDQQVKDGTLTEDQAAELQAIFASGPSGASGPGGPPPAADSDSAGDDIIASLTATSSASSSTTTGTGTDSTSSTSALSDSSDAATKLAALEAFLENLSASQQAQSGTYSVGHHRHGDGGSTASSGMVVNTTA